MTARRTKSIFEKKVRFVRLPKIQRLSDESLASLERLLAKSSQKNEVMLDRSWILAEQSQIPCTSSDYYIPSIVENDNSVSIKDNQEILRKIKINNN